MLAFNYFSIQHPGRNNTAVKWVGKNLTEFLFIKLHPQCSQTFKYLFVLHSTRLPDKGFLYFLSSFIYDDLSFAIHPNNIISDWRFQRPNTSAKFLFHP